MKSSEIIRISDLFNVYPLINNIINIIKDEEYNQKKQDIKIEGIKLIGILSGLIKEEDWKNEQKKLIIFNLIRKILKHSLIFFD